MELAQSPEYQHWSLRKFCGCAGVAYWRLRDCIQRQNSASYQAKRERLEAQQKLVEQIALQHPSYGYRLVYLQLQKLPQPNPVGY